MGEFPYACDECGGAYKKCGKGEEVCDNCCYHSNDGHESGCRGSFQKCPGGQSCWEDDVVVLVDGDIKHGEYEGYGQVHVPNDPDVEYVPIEFKEYIEPWGLENYKICQKIWCKSCYKPEFIPATIKVDVEKVAKLEKKLTEYKQKEDKYKRLVAKYEKKLEKSKLI